MALDGRYAMMMLPDISSIIYLPFRCAAVTTPCCATNGGRYASDTPSCHLLVTQEGRRIEPVDAALGIFMPARTMNMRR